MTNLEASIPKWQTRELPVSYDLEALLHDCNQLTSCRPADSNSVVIYGRTDPTTRVRVESKQTGLGDDIAARIQIIKDEFSMPFYAEYAKDDLWKHRSGIAETGDIARFVNDQFLNMAPYSRLLDINPSATSFHLATQDAFTTQKDLGGESTFQYLSSDAVIDTGSPEHPLILEAVRQYFTQVRRDPRDADRSRRQFAVSGRAEVDDYEIRKTLVVYESGRRLRAWLELQSTHPNLSDIIAATDNDREVSSLVESMKAANRDFTRRQDDIS